LHYQALEVSGLKCGKLIGKTSTAQRAKLIHSFGTPAGPDVLLMSSVGATGINLAAARVVILVVRGLELNHRLGPQLTWAWTQDQIFSWCAKEQIIGRLNRGKQLQTVIVYDLVALMTGDVALNSIARDKKGVLEAFLQKTEYGQGE
jgi:hypothetical protein